MENNKDWKERFEERFVDIDMITRTWDWKEDSDYRELEDLI